MGFGFRVRGLGFIGFRVLFFLKGPFRWFRA